MRSTIPHSSQVVGWGTVPLLVSLLQQHTPSAHTSLLSPTNLLSDALADPASLLETQMADLGDSSDSNNGFASSSKAQTYVLATLLLLAMHEPRHADVIVRWVLLFVCWELVCECECEVDTYPQSES